MVNPSFTILMEVGGLGMMLVIIAFMSSRDLLGPLPSDSFGMSKSLI